MQNDKKQLAGVWVLLPWLLISLSLGVLNCQHTGAAAFNSSDAVNRQELHDRTLSDTLARSYNLRLPAQFRLKQQIVLTIFNRQYDFIGYFIKGTAGRYRVLGFSEMGMKLFDLLYTGQTLDILFNSFKIPENPLKDGLSHDIFHLFFTNLATESVAGYRTAEGQILLKNQDQELFFEADTQKLAKSCYSLDGRLRSRVTYLDYKRVDSLSTPIPHYLHLENLRWHYSLDITLLSIEELQQADSMLRVK